ncbi:N2227-like protein [Tothia fuscella]|uniref:N2227-like protein n=1 Tax=Tothia fuscella TaxID=1048955 RepID=A0A9P4P5F8_9PEZI|nr:N2227-like protein [Tothia fuscella]
MSIKKSVLEQAVQYTKKLERNEFHISENGKLCQEIVRTALDFYGVGLDELNRYIHEAEPRNEQPDRISVNQALKHYVRDWSSEGKHERGPFRCILDTLDVYSPRLEQRILKPVKVLLPGAGLGRLGSDIVGIGGYEVTVNEWSLFMNVAYRFLEAQSFSGPYSFHPFVDSGSHHATTADSERAVSFPDQRMNNSVLMVEGDFTTAFQNAKGNFDFVITHCFIDTARNLIAFLETIHSTLHRDTGPSVQLSLDEIIAVSEHMGLQFLELPPTFGDLTFADKEVRWLAAIYGSIERALNMNGYKVQFWVARKK